MNMWTLKVNYLGKEFEQKVITNSRIEKDDLFITAAKSVITYQDKTIPFEERPECKIEILSKTPLKKFPTDSEMKKNKIMNLHHC